jgi:hypothetical protein
MDERRAKGICFKCDNKYIKGNKFTKNKLFYIDCEEEEDRELEALQDLELEEIPIIIPRYLERCPMVFNLVEIVTMLFICN